MSLPSFPAEIPFDCVMSLISDIRSKTVATYATVQKAAWIAGCASAYAAGPTNLVGAVAAGGDAVPDLSGFTIEQLADNLHRHIITVSTDAPGVDPSKLPPWFIPTLLQLLTLILQNWQASGK